MKGPRRPLHLIFNIVLGLLVPSPLVPGVAQTATLLDAERQTNDGGSGRLLVRFRADTIQGLTTIELADAGVRREREFRTIPGLTVMRLLPGLSAEEALSRLRARPDVAYAELDARVRLLTTPDDPLFPGQWGLANTGQQGGTPGADIRATDAWELTTGSREIVVGVIDSGVSYDHPDLAANIFTNAGECDSDGTDDDDNGYADDCRGIDARAWRGDPTDESGHGTHVAGIIGAIGNNGTGIAGVAWQVTIVPCKFIGADGVGWVSDAVACLDYLAALKDRGLNIVATNNSWAGGPYSQAMSDAIEAHEERGILFVAAAGNDGHDTDYYPLFPAAYTHANLIAVAAATDKSALAPFSREGRRSVHLVAPGDRILSTSPPDQYLSLPGTSMAAPFVTGAVALLAADDPTRSAADIRNLLLTKARRSPSLARTLSRGMLDIDGALSCVDESIRERVVPVESSLLVDIPTPVDLAVLHVECERPAGPVDVMIIPGNEVIALLDDGVSPDEQAGDGVYSARWTPSAAGEYLLRFGSDGSDNEEDAVAVEVRDGAAPPLLGDIVGYAVPSFERVLATAIAELTGDGTPDVAVLTRQLVYVFPGTTGHALGAPAEYELPAGLRDELRIGMDVSDLDGDGHDDVVVTGSGQYSALPFLGVFYQSPEGGLEPVESIATVSSRRVRVADLDGDGRQDLISAELEGATCTVELRRQTSSRVFGPPASLTVTFNDEPGLLQLLVGDVDGNGRTDVLVLAVELGRITGPHLALFLQNGTGGFEPPRFLEDRLMTAFVNAVALGDLDRDGVSEVVVAHGGNRASEWQPYLSIFSEESFDGGGSTDHIDTYDMPSAVVVADLDNDGRSDAIVAHNGFGSLSTHRQGPHGRLFPRLLTPFVLSDTWIPETLTAGDLDRDGAIDVVLGNSYGSIAIAWGEPVDPANMKSLSILVAGDGEGRVTSSPPGIDCGAVCDASFKAGTWVRLRGEAAPGSTFEGWRGHACTTGRDGSCTVVVMNSVVQADFGRSASRLTVNRTGNGSGRVTSDVPGIDCGDDCEEEYRKGWWVTLTAEPGPGFEFGGWSGSDYCTGPPEPSCRVHIDGDKTVSAYFKIPDPTLTVRVTGGQYGEVIFHGAPCRGICEYLVALGDAVYLNANPDPGARFGGWTGACTGFHVCRVVMDQDREVGASFDFPLAFDSTLIPDAETAVVYRAALAAQGGTPPYTFALIEGKLPKGLSLSSAGTIAGTPTNAASTSATVEVRDTAGGIAQRGISISVVRAVRVATRELPKGIVGRPYSATLSAKYGRAPMSWRISRGSLPAGLALDGASGQISGTPEAAGNVTLTVQVDDALGGQRTRTLKLKVRLEGQGG